MTFGLQLAVKAAFLLENATKIWAKVSQAMMRMKMTMTQFNRQQLCIEKSPLVPRRAKLVDDSDDEDEDDVETT